MRFVIGFLLIVVPALAQIDSAALRTTYGPPLNRETFRVRPGLELAVDYGANRQICSIEMPALPENEKQQILAEVAPESTRGKEIIRMGEIFGAAASISLVEYEHVIIIDSAYGNTRRSTTVRFKVEVCS
jgi:hypothetical protein